MIRRPPRSTRTDTLFPYTTLFRSNLSAEGRGVRAEHEVAQAAAELRPEDPLSGRGEEDKPQALLDLLGAADQDRAARLGRHREAPAASQDGILARSEARRVGKECVRTGRSRW